MIARQEINRRAKKIMLKHLSVCVVLILATNIVFTQPPPASPIQRDGRLLKPIDI
jgi:hypothetical protein